MSAFCIAAFDPGASGAFAFYFPSHPHLIAVEDFPIVDGHIDAAHLAEKLRQMKPDVAVIERVGSMPGQGVSSTFKFGDSYGVLKGVVGALAIPSHFVSPAVWKKHFCLTGAATKAEAKERSRALAIRLWPDSDKFKRVKDNGRAEAALIARFFAERNPGLIGQRKED